MLLLLLAVCLGGVRRRRVRRLRHGRHLNAVASTTTTSTSSSKQTRSVLARTHIIEVQIVVGRAALEEESGNHRDRQRERCAQGAVRAAPAAARLEV